MYGKNDVRIIQNKLILQVHRKFDSYLQSVLSRIKYPTEYPISDCLLARFNRLNHHVHNCLTVRNGVGQQIPRGLVRFCDKCFAVGYFVLLSPVQRGALVVVQVWRRT